MKLLKSKAGFTLIELLVVIGILAVLAAIAIPSVAGLIDRANVSADKTNANEMTNAIERFTSEYELYCQDIASGALDEDNLDSAQGRVKNVIGVTTRSGIEGIEFAQSATVADNVVAIYRDTKYPMNAYTMQKIVENYTKTSSSTFEPKQSDMHFWYSPDCGVVVVAEPNKTAAELDGHVISGMDAKGNDISGTDRDAKWIDLTTSTTANDTTDETSQYKLNGTWILNSTIDTGMQHNFKQDIQFTLSGGTQFYSMEIIHAGSEADRFQYYYYDSTVNNGAGAYMASTVYEYGWFSEGYRTVNFGNNYQEVSQEFYNWFTVNATKQ